MILAIETSCDETSAAVVSNQTILSNELFSQIKHHKEFGGVVPELASRLHAEYIDKIIKRALLKAGINLTDLTHIAVTVGPGLEGSLLVGITAANMLSNALNIPVIPVNHLHGHIFSVLSEHKLNNEVLACIASGGHTMLVHIKNNASFNIVANTMDDACGECLDKVARMLGLPYPGGPSIENAAKDGIVTIDLPHPVKNKKNSFSFSGLKTAVLNMVKTHDKVPVNDIAASVQDQVAKVLGHKIESALKDYSVTQIILCGGVFSNQYIRNNIINKFPGTDCLIPDKSLCTDNAGMIGLAAEVYMTLDGFELNNVDCKTNLGILFPKKDKNGH